MSKKALGNGLDMMLGVNKSQNKTSPKAGKAENKETIKTPF